MICCVRFPRHLATLLLVGACARVEFPQSRPVRPAEATGASALDPTRFEAEIRAFEEADRARPPPLGGVVFIGSSSIKNWTDLAADFPYQPRLVVLYAGDNDMAMGRTPEQILGDYRAFIARLRSAWPAARVAYVSIKPSPSRRAYVAGARETNRRIRAEIARDSLQAHVDVFTPMLNATGQPRPELFLPDSLQMTRAGYLLWRALLVPVVR